MDFRFLDLQCYRTPPLMFWMGDLALGSGLGPSSPRLSEHYTPDLPPGREDSLLC